MGLAFFFFAGDALEFRFLRDRPASDRGACGVAGNLAAFGVWSA